MPANPLPESDRRSPAAYSNVNRLFESPSAFRLVRRSCRELIQRLGDADPNCRQIAVSVACCPAAVNAGSICVRPIELSLRR